MSYTPSTITREKMRSALVMGRKNWLFSASQSGATASANLYSLIETAKTNDLEPYAYSRRINVQHRLVYQVLEEEHAVKVLRLWTHYE